MASSIFLLPEVDCEKHWAFFDRISIVRSSAGAVTEKQNSHKLTKLSIPIQNVAVAGIYRKSAPLKGVACEE